jgi:hypothetical protein
MEFNIVFSIRHLILENLDQVETPLFTISNQKPIKEKLISGDFKNAIGIRASQSFEKHLFGYHVIVDENIEDPSAIATKLNIETYSKTEAIKSFLFFLWFIKDNSISIDDSYGYQTKGYRYQCIPNHTIPSNSLGKFENVQYSKVELDRALEISEKYIAVCGGQTTDMAAQEFNENYGTQNDVLKSSVDSNQETNNLQRAITFLNTARSSPYLPYKISLYMPIFESLFSDSASEATQKVSERVAFYVSNDKAERLEIFKTVKEAYDIRSRFLHGQRLSSSKSKPSYLQEVSNNVDEITRKVLNKIIMQDSALFLQANSQFLSELIFQ